MRAAVIDIGSNSTKLVIGQKGDGDIKVLESLKNVTGIGKGTFYKGRISQDIINTIVNVLEKYKKLIAEYEVAETRVIATTAVREAENRDVFLDTIRRKTGFEIEVLNVGDVVYFIDAFLSYKLKEKYPINEKNLLIAELGAGNLDISVMEKGYTLFNFGVPIGTLRVEQFKSRIDASQKATYEALGEYVDNEIQNLKAVMPDIKIDDIVLIDESYSAALNSILPRKKREASFFSFQFYESRRLLSRVTQGKLEDLAEKYHMPADISATIDGYALIVNKLFKLIKKRSLYILATSLSEAVLANMIFGFDLAEKYNKVNQLVSVAKFLCRRYGSDLKHTKHVAFIAESFFQPVKDLLGLGDKEKLYLSLAAYLHNIGMFVNNRGHHKHAEYIINASNLFRLTPQEIKCIAAIARYHRRSYPQKTHFFYGSLPLAEQLLVQKLSSILRIANALDSAHKQKVKKLEISSTKQGELTLTIHAAGDFTLEKVMFEDRKQLFEEISGSRINLRVEAQD
ncbi:MAG: HD domain-containing protein [Candidatus Omnitrophica bacterium]|nr:HD domain-containing protein [Candidatus Omnitrophota bacterium]